MCRNCRGGGWKGVRVFGGRGVSPQAAGLGKNTGKSSKRRHPAGIRGRQRHGEKGKAAGSPARTWLCCKRQKFTPEIKSLWHGASSGAPRGPCYARCFALNLKTLLKTCVCAWRGGGNQTIDQIQQIPRAWFTRPE